MAERGLAAIFLPKKEEGNDALKQAAQGLIEAVKSDDAEEVKAALLTFLDAREMDEPEED